MKKFIYLLLLAAACKKSDDSGLPGPSNTGEGYLACFINGKPYTFKGTPSSLNPSGIYYRYGKYSRDTGFTRDFALVASDIGRQFAEVVLTLTADTSYRFPKNQRIYFSQKNNGGIFVCIRSPVDYTDKYYYADNTQGWIDIVKSDSIGSGTFAFNAYVLDINGNKTADSLVVSDGRFDIKNQ